MFLTSSSAKAKRLKTSERVLLFVFFVLSATQNHLFVWMEDGVTEVGHANYDKLIAGKSGYLNATFWLIRAAVFLVGWNLYRHLSRKNCLAQDESNDNTGFSVIK